MVANGYDGLGRGVERGIGTPTPSGLNGVAVYRRFFYNVGWQILETRWSQRKGPRWSWA